MGNNLTKWTLSVTFGRMGRPPLNVKATVIRLPEGFADRIDAVAGTNRRSQFIREAVERELKLREASDHESKMRAALEKKATRTKRAMARKSRTRKKR